MYCITRDTSLRDFYIMTLIEKIKKVNLTLLAITQLLGGLTFSLLSPFYTEEATQKGTIHTFEKKAGTVRKYIRVFYLVHNRESRVYLAILCMDVAHSTYLYGCHLSGFLTKVILELT